MLEAAVTERRATTDTGPVLQRSCPCGGHTVDGGDCEGCRSARQEAFLRSDHAGSGRPLEPAVRQLFEGRFGHDFTGVRVHTDAHAAHAADRQGADAYTVGRDVVFGRDRYRRATPNGRALLAHELSHVLQQRRGRGSEAGNAEEQALEREAERAAGLVNVRGAAIRIRSRAPSVLQRQRLGTRVTPPTGATSPFRTVEATFDGRDFVVQGTVRRS
jgi:Domain of unknown function (DUF4157)